MFTYIINEQKVTFATIEEAMPALEEAEKMGWTVVEVAFGEKEKPKKKKQQEDSTEVSEAPAETSIFENIDSANFAEDLALSASDGSDVFAQPELESSSEDTSLDLPAVTREDIEEFKEENSVISLKAAEDLFGGDNNRIKEVFQTVAKGEGFTYEERQAEGRSEGSYHPIGMLTYTDPSTGIPYLFEADVANFGITGDDIKKKAKEFKDFLDSYGDKETLQKIGTQAETLYKEQFTPTEQEITEGLPPRDSIFDHKVVYNVVGGYGGMMGTTSQKVVSSDIYPYDKELEEKRNQLISEGSDLGVDELIEKSKDMVYADIKAKKRLELVSAKTDDFLKVDENYDKRGIASLGGAIYKTKKGKELAKDKIVLKSNIDTSLATSKNLNLVVQYAEGDVPEAELTYNGESITLGDLSDGSAILTYKTGVQITQYQKDFIDQQQNDFESSLKYFEPLMDKLISTTNSMDTLELQLKASGLNFSALEKMATTFATGTAGIIGGIGMFGAKTVNFLVNAPLILAGNDSFYEVDEALDEWGSEFAKVRSDIRSTYTRDISVDEAFSSSNNFFRFAGQEISTQAPVLLAMVASGGTLAPYVVGAWTAGEKMMDIAYENSLIKEGYQFEYEKLINEATGAEKIKLEKELQEKIDQDITGPFASFAKGIGVGIANGGFTALTTNPILQNGMRMFRGSTGREFLLNFQDYWKLNWKRSLIYDNALELSGELATNVVENAIDGRPIFENAKHVAVSSLGFSFAFSTLPFLKGAGIRVLSSNKTIRDIDTRQKEIFETQKAYNELDKRTRAAKAIKKSLTELQLKQQQAVKKAERSASNGITLRAAGLLSDANQKINDAKAEASDIVNNKDLTYKQKEAQLKKMQENFAEGVMLRDAFLSGVFKDEFHLLGIDNQVKYQEYIDKAMNEMNAYAVTEQVKQKASDLYNAQIIKDKFDLNKKTNQRAQQFDTIDLAVDFVNSLPIDDAQKKEIIANLKAGAGGVNIVTRGTDRDGSTVTIPVSVVESMVAEQKIGVMEHENSHSILDKLFEKNPEKAELMASQIKNWMQRNQFDLHVKIQVSLSPYKQAHEAKMKEAKTKAEKAEELARYNNEVANEYLANFFELFSGGVNFDPLAPGNQAFLGLTGYMMQDVAGDNYNFDFKGPDDFAAFAISIAKGMKDGTVNISKLEALRKQAEKIESDSSGSGSGGAVSRFSRPLQDKFDEAEDALNDAEDMFNLDPNDPTLRKAVETAQKAYDIAEANLEKGVEGPAETAAATDAITEPVEKEKIVRPKADKSKRKYSLDKEVKRELEPKIAKVQKANKDLRAAEKKLNEEAIAEIEAIDDKVESRTSKEERIAALKAKPLTIRKTDEIRKLEAEIIKALDVPISKATNLFTEVFYNKISENAKKATNKQDFKTSVKAEIIDYTINEFKPITINREGETVFNDIEDIIFQRGGFRLRDKAEREGVIGQAAGISRGADSLTNIAAEGSSTSNFDESSPEYVAFKEKRKASSLLTSSKRYEQAKQIIQDFWEKNEGNTKVESFKGLPNLINNILSEMFGVTESTLAARSGNLNKSDYNNAIEAFTKEQAVYTIKENGVIREERVALDDVSDFQKKLSEKRSQDKSFSFKREANETMVEGFLKFLPLSAAPEYKYESGRKGRYSGKSTGLPKNLMALAYQLEGRGTKGVGNIVRSEKQNLTEEEVLEAIGARRNADGTIVKKPEVGGRDREGQTMLGIIKLYGRMVTNEISRTETNLDPMTMLDLEMGKNPAMYSLPVGNLNDLAMMLEVDFEVPANFGYKGDVFRALRTLWEKKKGKLTYEEAFKETHRVLTKKGGIQVARTFSFEVFNDFIDARDLTKSEMESLVKSSFQNALGKSYKYILQQIAYPKAVQSFTKNPTTENIVKYIQFYGRSVRDGRVNGIITNEDLYNSIAKELDITPKALKDTYGIELTKDTRLRKLKGAKEATLEEVFVIKKKDKTGKMVGAFKTITIEDIKAVRTKSNAEIDGMALKIEKDVEVNREFVKNIVTNAKAAYADAATPQQKRKVLLDYKAEMTLLSGGQLTTVRKMYSLGKVYKTTGESMLEHETSVGFLLDQLSDYVTGKTEFNLDEKFKSLYVNVIPVEANAVLMRDGGPERYDQKADGKGKGGFKDIVKGLEVYNATKKIQFIADQNNYSLPLNLRQKGLSLGESIKQVENFDKAITLGNSLDQPTKGISVWDFDDTLATTKSNVLFTMPDGTKGKLDASRFAKEGDAMLANGAKFDFSEFSKVMNGAKGPFFNKAVDRNRKFGNKDVYILTARPANSANAIHEFLKGIGLDIPLANITGLASSDPQAKANWVVGKFAEGYNDFYFADDHVGNVNAVSTALSALDNVRSNVELAKAARYSKKIRAEYSTILDKLRGGDVIEGNKVFSAEQQIDEVFDWVNSLDIPEKNKAKYKRAALNFVAKSPTNFPVDTEIVSEAMRIAELKKLNVMDFSNPRDIIDKFAGEVKAKRLDPNKEKQFFNKKSLPEGVETFQIMPTRGGQQAVRRILDTHWGEKTNPWCVTAQEKTYTEAEKKELKINNPKYPIGTKDKMIGEEIMDKGVVIKSANTAPTDFVGNLMPGWVEGPTTYASTNFLDQLIIDSENEQDFNQELDRAKAQGYKVIEGSYDISQDNFYVQVERNNDPKVNKVFKYTQYFKAIDPSLTQEEFNNGPAKGGTVYNPRIEATGPAELTSQSFQMWENYGKPTNPDFVNEDTGAVEIDDGGFEIAFKDGKLLALKNLGGSKQEWFDRMDHGTKDLALKVPRNTKGKIIGNSTMMNTDSGRVFNKDYTIRYSKKIEPTLNNLINELSINGDAVNSSTTNLKAQPKEVKEVINTLDVKSDTQQARVRYSMDLNKRFNEIIEEKTGIESFKEYQSVKAKKKGAKKGRLSFFIPPSAEDFMGLLYKTLPKGKKGESAMAFYKEHLIDPYWKGVSALRTQRISIAKQYRALKKELGIVPRKLKKPFKYEDENGNMKESLFSKEDAIRVYVWDAQGFDIEGLSNVDLPVLVNYVNSQPDLKAFADRLLEINKNNNPKAPAKSWPGGTITSDLLNTLNTDGRKKMLEVWQQNVDAIFTETNINKLEAAFGAKYVEALRSSLQAMRTGKNSTPTGNRVTDGFVRWLNAAVGNIMFLNRRSAVLQLISFTNFINFEGNNLYQAGKAFANQEQYWKDWVMLMNSDYLVDRRDGLKINVNEADIATTAKENGFQGVLAKVLQAGFTPTKVADSVAIATGGATFYRNKVNALVKGGMNLAAAEKQAMLEFMDTAEKTQQSSDPIMTSKQQREPIGRIILAFANTPSQYARIIKRSTQDLIAGRGNPKTHLSRIAYYGFLQNALFNFLQQGMFAAMMGDDDEEDDSTETPEALAKQEESRDKKMFKVANSMADGILRGIGVGGAIVSAVKNLAIKFYERSKKTRNQRLAETLKDGVVAVSPPLGSKLSKIGKVGNSLEWGKKEIEFDEMSLKHPYVTAASNAIAAVTGLPTDRAVGMAIDAADIASSETETWMKPLIALGWPKWQLMSEEATAKEREEKKERFKELEADKEFQKLNPTEQRRSVLRALDKKEQEEILWNSGVLTRKQIRNLKTEANRIDKIMALRDKKQFEKDMESLSKGGDILPEPKVTRPPTKRKDSLK